MLKRLFISRRGIGVTHMRSFAVSQQFVNLGILRDIDEL